MHVARTALKAIDDERQTFKHRLGTENRFLSLAELSAHICLSKQEILQLVEAGDLPKPHKRGRAQPKWRWEEVEGVISNGWEDRFRVYFLEAMEFIKIGTTTSIAQRIEDIQSGLPCAAMLLHDEPGHYDLETDLHRRFAHLRVKGEWFRKEPELLDFIRTLKERK